MKMPIKLEELGLLISFVFTYQHFFPSSWGIFFALFFVSDLSSFVYRYFSSKAFVLRIPSSSFSLNPSYSIPIYPLNPDDFMMSMSLL